MVAPGSSSGAGVAAELGGCAARAEAENGVRSGFRWLGCMAVEVGPTRCGRTLPTLGIADGKPSACSQYSIEYPMQAIGTLSCTGGRFYRPQCG